MLSGNVVDGYESDVNALDDVADGSTLNSFAFITFNSTLPLKVNELDLAQMRYRMEKFEGYIDDHNLEYPAAKGIQFCVVWYFLIAGEAVVANSFQGIAISLTFAAFVLVLANSNWLIAALAVFSIVGVVSLVALCMVIMGWSVDFLGSICLIIVIGLSVDYTVRADTHTDGMHR